MITPGVRFCCSCSRPVLARHDTYQCSDFESAFRAFRSSAIFGPIESVAKDPRNYERYLALVQAEAQPGNLIRAENYCQYADIISGRCRQAQTRLNAAPDVGPL